MLTHILIIAAMSTEANYFIQDLHLKYQGFITSPFPSQLYTGKLGNKQISLVTNGGDEKTKIENVGTQPAVLSTTLGILKLHPDLIISAGTAGGDARRNTFPFDVVVSQEINFIARRIPGEYKEYGIGHYKSYVFNKSTIQKLNLKTGIVCTGDSFDKNKVDEDTSEQLGCNVKEMEAAGVAWTAFAAKVPMIAVKGITDDTNDPHEYEQFKRNFDGTMKKLSTKLKELLTNA